MIHAFCSLDHYFLIDVESGTVAQIDKKAFEEINKLTLKEKESGAINTPIDQDVLDELMLLKDQEALFVKKAIVEHENKSNNIIKALCLNISHDCNMSCAYCFASKNNESNMLMDKKTARNAIDFLLFHSGDRKTLEVDFFGGEPLLNYDCIVDTIKYARQKENNNKKFKFTLTTNALLLTDDKLDFINKEIYNVVLSIDGRKKTHNNVRKAKDGSDSFEIIQKNIKNFLLKRGDKSYFVRGTFTNHNLDFCLDAKFLYDLGAKYISIEPVVLDMKNALAIKADNVPSILDEYDKLASFCLDKKSEGFDFFHFRNELEDGPCLSKRSVGCSAGNEYVAIDPKGDIYPCHQFVGKEEFCLGNINKNYSDINKDLVDKFCSVNVHNKVDCCDCFAKYYCSGGCMASAYNRYGDINEIDDFFCPLIKKRFELATALYCLNKQTKHK